MVVTRHNALFLATAGQLTDKPLPAGARAVQFQIKEAIRKVQGEELHRDVSLTGDLDGGWYSVDKWGISVHCLTRDHRADLQLEELWGEAGNVRWWRQSERPLTLDNIGTDAATAAQESEPVASSAKVVRPREPQTSGFVEPDSEAHIRAWEGASTPR